MKIETYSFSEMVYDGKTYTSDLIIYPDHVDASWWRQQGHRLAADDIGDILAASPEILVIGTGYAGNMTVPDDVRQTLENHQIKVVAQTTADATATFNRLVEEGKDVAGAFHLTC